mgnify:CR=1 FL=1
MSNDLTITPEQISSAAAHLGSISQDVAGDAQVMFSSVSDGTFLGTNDALGAIASSMYEAAVQAFADSINSVIQELDAQATLLNNAAAKYSAADSQAAQVARRVGV